jgi:hypothetical protein
MFRGSSSIKVRFGAATETSRLAASGINQFLELPVLARRCE